MNRRNGPITEWLAGSSPAFAVLFLVCCIVVLYVLVNLLLWVAITLTMG